MQASRVLATISAIYLSVVLIYYIAQRDFIFYPSGLHVLPETAGLGGVAEIKLHTPDGETLIAWYAAPDFGKPTLFYLHGNAGALIQRKDRIRLYRGQGYGVFALAYRGFSGSTGRPTESAIVQDALLAYDHLVSLTPAHSKIVIYGESLGTGVAVQVASKRRSGGVILESPFSSAVDVGAQRYPFLPVHWLLRDRFESINYIRKINAPLLILHGEHDRTVPPAFGRKLFAAAQNPKQAYFIADATHYTLYEHGAFEKVREFLEGLRHRPKPPQRTIPVNCRTCAPTH